MNTPFIAPIPYPIDAFPVVVREAMLEIGNVQAPASLIAASMLVTMLTTAQGRVNKAKGGRQ